MECSLCSLSLRMDLSTDESFLLTRVMMFSCLASVYCLVAAQVYRRRRYSLEPIHIFEMNTLVSISVYCLCTVLKSIFILHSSLVLCSVIVWLTYYARLNIFSGVMMSQLDRFLALHLHASYKERVTPWGAKGVTHSTTFIHFFHSNFSTEFLFTYHIDSVKLFLRQQSSYLTSC